MQPDAVDRSFSRLVVALTFVSFMVSATTRMLETLMPPIAEGLGASLLDMGVVIAAFSIGYGVIQPLTALLADRYGKLRLISSFMLMAGLLTWLAASSISVNQLAFLRFLCGLSLGACIALSLAYIGEFVVFEKRQGVISQFLTGILLGQIFGASFAGLLSESMSWREVFNVFGVLTSMSGALLAALLLLKQASDSQTSTKVGPGIYLEIITSKSAQPILLIGLLEGAFFFSAFAFVASFLRDRQNWDYLSIGLIMTGYGVGGAIYALLSRQLCRMLSSRQRILISGLMLSFAYFLFPWLSSKTSFFLCFAGIGFGFYMLHLILQTQATEMYPKARGAAMCMFALVIFIGQSIGAPIFALMIYSLDYPVSYALSAFFCLMFALIFRRQQER